MARVRRVTQKYTNPIYQRRLEIDLFLTIFLCSILVIAALVDIIVQKIPNLITLPTMSVGLLCHTLTSGWDGFLFSFSGLFIGTFIFFIPYIFGGMGAGDAKLMGAVGAIVGTKGVLISSLLTFIAGGLYAFVILLSNTPYLKRFITKSTLTIKTFALTRQLIPIPADELEKRPKLCYGIAIAIGTLTYILLSFYGYSFGF